MKNPNEPCDVTITFFDSGKSALLLSLSLEQQRALSELLQSSGVRYQWEARLCSALSFSKRTGGLWRRALRWMTSLLLLIAILSAPALAQRAIEPIRLQISSSGAGEPDKERGDLLRAELNKRRDVAFVSRRPDFTIVIASAPFVQGESVVGESWAVLLVQAGSGSFRLFVDTGPDSRTIAGIMAAKLTDSAMQTREER
ncbi:MAG TPA: hypothetical protein VFV58_13270 [Blastocatellia bacterium]|jgi:hypothetical protein|nr:hypothetical protein [Blastocatellia bacterium]